MRDPTIAAARTPRSRRAAARVSASGNNRRPDRARTSARACPRAPASRARFRPRACPRPRKRRATRCRPARPGAGDCIVEPPLGVDLRTVRSGRGAEPPRPRATGAASHAIVTRGDSCARSQSREPLARIELAPADKAAREQPAERRFGQVYRDRARGASASRRAAVTRHRSLVRSAGALRARHPITPPCSSRGLPHRQNCRTVEKPVWLVWRADR